MYSSILNKTFDHEQQHDLSSEGIPQCETCNPCGDCNLDQIILPLDMVADGIKLCDMCDPCARWEKCAYCGNLFSRCDQIVETEDGLMHASCADTPAFKQLCQQPVEKLAQHVLVQRDMIRDLWSQQTDTKELKGLRDQLSCSNARIIELEELLEDTQDRLRRMIEDCSAEWSGWDE